MANVSMLRPTASTSAIQKMIQCVVRLYQPDKLSIALSYQASMFARARFKSPSAASIAVNNARCTGGFLILRTLARTDWSDSGGAAGSLLTSSVTGPLAAISSNAIAKLREGMYEGIEPPLANNFVPCLPPCAAPLYPPEYSAEING